MEAATNRLGNRIVVVDADADPVVVGHVAADDELLLPAVRHPKPRFERAWRK